MTALVDVAGGAVDEVAFMSALDVRVVEAESAEDVAPVHSKVQRAKCDRGDGDDHRAEGRQIEHGMGFGPLYERVNWGEHGVGILA
jgi:hypothetical protein